MGTEYKAKVLELEAQLLYKLANVQGNLLDDKDILDVLNNTKTTSMEVAEKLKAASETQQNIQTTCEDYRPVATRGSIIYFLFTECSQINPMYQNSLKQFLDLFDRAMNEAEPNPTVSVRCKNIIETATHITWFYFTRGVFERHKLLYTLLLALKIQMKTGEVKADEFNMLLWTLRVKRKSRAIGCQTCHGYTCASWGSHSRSSRMSLPMPLLMHKPGKS